MISLIKLIVLFSPVYSPGTYKFECLYINVLLLSSSGKPFNFLISSDDASKSQTHLQNLMFLSSSKIYVFAFSLHDI